MVKGLIGKKIEMTQIFNEHRRHTPVTKILIEPNFIVQMIKSGESKTKKAQVGTGIAKKPKKPNLGHAKTAGVKNAPKIIREVEYDGEIQAGEEINLGQVFKKGSIVNITGISKGKGFTGVVKRWGFAGGPRTHGQSDRERAPGSIGATTTPGRVFKGMKMAGHKGQDKVTILGLEVIDVNNEKNTMLVKGSVPGARGSILIVHKSAKKKKAFHETEIPSVPEISATKEETSGEIKEEPAQEEKFVSAATSTETTGGNNG